MPGPAYLARRLRALGVESTQWDAGIALALRLYGRTGLRELFDAVEAHGDAHGLPEPAWQALAQRARHEAVADGAVALLQGRDTGLAPRVAAGRFLPPGPRVDAAQTSTDDGALFGRQGIVDRARFLATAWLADIADLVAATVDPGFALSSYQHHLAVGPVSYDAIAARLDACTLVDGWLDQLVDDWLASHDDVDVVCLSVPFPGTLYGALRIGRRARAAGRAVWMGGGYVTTELREVDEPRLWDNIDALCWDDGEGPLQALLEHHRGGPDRRHRTRTRDGLHDAPFPRPAFVPAAWYGDLDLSAYLQVVDGHNPAQRLWGDGRWNKLTLAHGCYWKRCAFCDIELDYIARYEAAGIPALVDAIEELVAATGQRGFHLVDEAAPPRLMKALALELLARGVDIAWWGNIRFETSFTPDLCRLLAASGLVMVTGGLEVASDRLLAAMDKGITVEQAARAAAAFQQAGVRVHAYLMYGFPTQTDQESVDSMDVVRQLFAHGLLDSAFWHRFVLTRHSGVFADPARHRVQLPPLPTGVFATNDLPHGDPTGGDHDRFDAPLVAALHAWMRGADLDLPVSAWLPDDLPAPTEAEDRIARALRAEPVRGDRLVWLGGEVLQTEAGAVLFGPGGAEELTADEDAATWLVEVLDAARPGQPPLSWEDARAAFPGGKKTLRRLLRAADAIGLVRI
ncbi:MAG: radical SAM protein [Alphaproteobacteria bacterium]|nr:radical SAM protein [Alphaproteobacteria bacterium]